MKRFKDTISTAKSTSPLSFLEAVELIAKGKKKIFKKLTHEQNLEESFVSFVIREIFNLPNFQQKGQCRLIIVQKTGLKQNRLLFDGQFLQKDVTPVQCFF